jgi:hypothetical protein
MGSPNDSGRDETRAERDDRNLSELLQELRVALPGVQVLFAFLLTVPFTQRFGSLSDFEKDLYFGVLLSTAVASMFLIAPSIWHRILFRHQDKEHLVVLSNRFALVGLGFLALAISGAVLLIAHVVFATVATVGFTAAIGGMLIALWYAGPLLRLRHVRREEKKD